jgi:hypothetical protein
VTLVLTARSAAGCAGEPTAFCVGDLAGRLGPAQPGSQAALRHPAGQWLAGDHALRSYVEAYGRLVAPAVFNTDVVE